MNKKIKIHNIDGHKCESIDNFIPLQNDFKKKSQDQINKLKNRIIKVGFKYDFYVYVSKEEYNNYSKGTFFIVDAHSRLDALKELRDEGYIIDNIPYTTIQAKNIKEAKKEILYLNSRYSEIDASSEFVENNFDINVDIDVEIPELDLEGINISSNDNQDAHSSDNMTMRFEFEEDEYRHVYNELQKINANKEIALLALLKYES